MRQIPKRLLPDSCSVRCPAPSDYGGEFTPAMAIGHVRFERSSAYKPNGQSTGDSPKGTLFIDRVNSDWSFEIPKGSLVSVNGGEEMMAVECIALMDFDKVHHWEVALK